MSLSLAKGKKKRRKGGVCVAQLIGGKSNFREMRSPCQALAVAGDPSADSNKSTVSNDT